ncbi:MAG TPA: glycosyltransferase family 1 protein [Planctomycetota bacterium]|nr:glycosyltransferase family 1 protein [Planctomycetota bacterium]
MKSRRSIRVALEASALLAPRPTGIGVYGRALAQALERRRASGSPFACELIHPWTRSRRGFVPIDDGPRRLRRYATGRLLERRFALVHALDTRLPRDHRGRLVATVFDTISLLPGSAAAGFSPPGFRRRKERVYGEIARSADAIITLSESTRKEFERLFPTSARLVTIPPGVDPPLAFPSRAEAAEMLRRRGIAAPFVLTVGALCPRKNLEAAVAAFESAGERRPGLKLVIAGEPSFGWEGSRGEAAVRRARGAVVLAGYLPRPELRAAYRLAEALIHLSHHEGYGLTVLEALAAGSPVVAADRGGLREAAGEAGWLVDPDLEGEAARVLGRVLEGGQEVEARRERGRAHAALRTWDAAARKVEELYREVLDS